MKVILVIVKIMVVVGRLGVTAATVQTTCTRVARRQVEVWHTRVVILQAAATVLPPVRTQDQAMDPAGERAPPTAPTTPPPPTAAAAAAAALVATSTRPPQQHKKLNF